MVRLIFTRFGSLYFDILELCKVLNFTFSHVLRDANGCAHNLARYALEFSDYSF